MWQQIKKLNEQRGEKLKELRAILKGAEEAKRELSADESAKFDALSAEAEAFLPKIEQLERAHKVESDANEFATRSATGGGRDAVGGGELPADQRAKDARTKFTRGLRGDSMEYRSLTVAGQGVVGDRPFYDSVVRVMKYFGGVRAAGAEVIASSNGNPLTIPTADDTSNTGRLVGEAVTNNVVTEPTLGVKTLSAYKFDSDWIKVSIELLQDADYDIEGLVSTVAGERLARVFNTYSTTGTGSSQPQGFVTAATLGKTTAGVAAVTYDEMLDLLHSVDVAYRDYGRAAFQMHDLTLAAVRKLKDTAGRYIWLPGESTQPDRLMGYKYVVNNDMAVMATGAKFMAFGDFSKYKIRDVTQIYVVRADELFIGDGLIGYKVISRNDGLLADATAVKYMKNA